MIMLFLWLPYVLSITLNAQAHHWIPQSHDVVHGVRIGHIDYIKNRPFDQKLRFQIHYDVSVNILSLAKQKLVKQRLIPTAVNYFHLTYSVRSTKEQIKLQWMCKDNSYFLKDSDGNSGGDIQYCKGECLATSCGPVKVPASFLDHCRVCNEHGYDCKIKNKDADKKAAGKNADFILFVSAIPTQHCHESNIVAYASYCQQENALNRPVAGFANLCPGKLETDAQSFENLLATVKHEIYHALGFSVGLFAFYRDKDGKPLVPRDKHGLPPYNNKTKLYYWNEKIMKYVVRKKWSVSGGHKEHQVQMIVTPNVRREARKHFQCPDLEGAELENQGGEGTALTHWEKRIFENEAMTGKATVKDISTYGGAVELADFCPFYQKFTLTDESGRKRGTTCTLGENAAQSDKNYALEAYSKKSKCVEHGRHWTARKGLLTRTMLDWGSGCYRYKCSDKGLILLVGGKEYHCSREGKRLEISGLMNNWKVNGSLICPPCEEFCGVGVNCASSFISLQQNTPTEFDEKEATVDIENSNSSPVRTLDYFATFIVVIFWLLFLFVM
eukprot:Seg1303.3 transcript_id=Seg1303.3/GoldUCD/mRNA.D3Y31 product="Leishmanolysin-like peptidase" protein_id=Seg1303.3/GoldUCD/D3Y31